ncbi:hypothetical protein H6P81_008458 [Aristolochia fimbriata]|uniref:Uncharacterized protein n=1 Tax=Aristolochia fimbriata TaxID=158543 RepID=A0AAV7EI29_ARIFI|nr:hypothetical protein H6P81_008458 [Aristolochia fimbriata]
MQSIGETGEPVPDTNPKRSSNTIPNSIRLDLLLEFQRKIKRQVDFTGDHVQRLQSRFPSFQCEGLQSLSCDQPLKQEKVYAQILEGDVHLTVRIGEIGDDDEVAVQVLRRVEAALILQIYSRRLEDRILNQKWRTSKGERARGAVGEDELGNPCN